MRFWDFPMSFGRGSTCLCQRENYPESKTHEILDLSGINLKELGVLKNVYRTCALIQLNDISISNIVRHRTYSMISKCGMLATLNPTLTKNSNFPFENLYNRYLGVINEFNCSESQRENYKKVFDNKQMEFEEINLIEPTSQNNLVNHLIEYIYKKCYNPRQANILIKAVNNITSTTTLTKSLKDNLLDLALSYKNHSQPSLTEFYQKINFCSTSEDCRDLLSIIAGQMGLEPNMKTFEMLSPTSPENITTAAGYGACTEQIPDSPISTDSTCVHHTQTGTVNAGSPSTSATMAIRSTGTKDIARKALPEDSRSLLYIYSNENDNSYVSESLEEDRISEENCWLELKFTERCGDRNRVIWHSKQIASKDGPTIIDIRQNSIWPSNKY
ncbi:hypothetical protein DERF_010852 [Dermatophagoides farinae]|uniref:Uncharacterized protein n=1 Tax=Dermatophagoides farinae TaxID=6954 RepID=A0A922HR50_DERFA|nr:hypothetical protein DERF_010852 [Dermatophagoides farinae]